MSMPMSTSMSTSVSMCMHINMHVCMYSYTSARLASVEQDAEEARVADISGADDPSPVLGGFEVRSRLSQLWLPPLVLVSEPGPDTYIYI